MIIFNFPNIFRNRTREEVIKLIFTLEIPTSVAACPNLYLQL